MNSSGNWESDRGPSTSMNAFASSLQHELQTQDAISQDMIDSIVSVSASSVNYEGYDEVEGGTEENQDVGMGTSNSTTEQPSLEQIQKVYYTKGLEELDNLQLLDLSPLANWKLSSFKQGYGLSQLRYDSPDSYWQSDGSNGNNNNNAITNNQLSNPHSITIQFAKKVSLERISIFTNFSLDESYTPSRIRIMAGSSDGWDLSEVCTVNFSKPIGWSHIIFNGIRNDGVLKCFMVKLVILANHQDGKDSHIRAIRCFGKKSANVVSTAPKPSQEILKDLSLASGMTSASGLLLNHISKQYYSDDEDENNDERMEDKVTSRILGNVNDIIGFNSAFQSLEFKSVSSIR
ncbi:galactose-binding like protein [Suhomyces tanzawaensis NRRL Y-17324]|uniref:Galactose-binding like protein n=1 Tax=Suhomyces tanzawaensis NRRL Y-17324 TaxID=984487 RepID=A0A1E4SDF8_9ASCO|nr:galactose-binding like protein [Suhomyces tanzawaensis NRRL Y-17324]ODV77535.1 galactose-binding like protein [Suhomyces tanzawaensis NRRL Y-17324]